MLIGQVVKIPNLAVERFEFVTRSSRSEHFLKMADSDCISFLCL